MSDTPERYSDKRLKESFDAYLLLSEPLKFLPSAVWKAVREDFPDLEWSFSITHDPPFDSSTVSMATYFPGSGPDGHPLHGLINFISTPGPIGIDMGNIIQKSRLAFPEAQQVIDTHQSVFSISVSSVDTSLPARFDAARRLSSLVAAFADLPMVKGVYFPNADLIRPPKHWKDAANQAAKGEFPAFVWVNYVIAKVSEDRFTVSSCGCAAFNGHEVTVHSAQLPPPEAMMLAYSAVLMLLQYGHVFEDSNTIGYEGSDVKIRLRHCPEGMHGSQTDQWILLHPTTLLDEMKMFGKRRGVPPPPGMDVNLHGDSRWLARLVQRFKPPQRSRPH